MKSLLIALALVSGLVGVNARAEDSAPAKPDSATMKFSFTNEEITKVLEYYSQATGQVFVIDPGVRGRTTILGANSVSKDEAFDLLSTALANDGFAIMNEQGKMVVVPARTAARADMAVETTLPTAKPERMVTYIMQLKNSSADEANRNLRILPSKDGEMVPVQRTNSVIITDWASNIQRIDKILRETDKHVDTNTTKIADAAKREQRERMKNAPMPPPQHARESTSEEPMQHAPPPNKKPVDEKKPVEG